MTVMVVRSAGDKLTEANESSADWSLPMVRMKGEVLMAGVGFNIPDNPIIMSEIAVSEVTELVMMI